jgi:hypothetical protein
MNRRHRAAPVLAIAAFGLKGICVKSPFYAAWAANGSG